MTADIADSRFVNGTDFAAIFQGNRNIAASEEFENPQTGWVTQCFEHGGSILLVHDWIIATFLEISK